MLDAEYMLLIFLCVFVCSVEVLARAIMDVVVFFSCAGMNQC